VGGQHFEWYLPSAESLCVDTYVRAAQEKTKGSEEEAAALRKQLDGYLAQFDEFGERMKGNHGEFTKGREELNVLTKRHKVRGGGVGQARRA
jgi:uncharacterized coiled-coil DUF342 family protein